MKHLKLFESSETAEPTLRDIIGNIKSEKKVGYNTIYETEKGCITNILGRNTRNIDLLDCNVKYHRYGDNYGEIFLKHPEERYGRSYYVYLENDFPKIISSYPGDERGCILFKDVFIASGHDGNYLWDVKTGEFKSNTW